MNFLQRLAARVFFGTTSVFEGANRSPRRASVPGSAPQDATLDLSPGIRSELVRRSRYLVKNSGFLREIVGSMALYSIGDGILPQPASKDTAWNKKALDYFTRWARHADISGRFNLIQCEHLACKALDVDGEIFILKTMENGEPKIQLIESHRIGSSDIDESKTSFIDGVQLSNVGKPVAYRLLKDDGGFTDLKAHDVLHIFDPDAVSQLRGFPTLQHSINHMLDVMELLALEKHAVKDNADVARVLKTNKVNVDDRDFRIDTPRTPSGSDAGFLQTILGGKLVKLQPDEALESFQSNRPSPTF
ncbi:MAG: phage portal protein, partial [Akkermansia sp.]|nr:phage portal protein [Akkermansia sp.]